jgi:glycosyltransferase involved in cell wall biosynthesis
LLFYFPTPGAERLGPLVEKTDILYPTVPDRILLGKFQASKKLSSLKHLVKRTRVGGKLAEAAVWMRFLPTFSSVPRLYRRFTAGRYDLIHVNSVPVYYSAAPLAASRLAHIPAVAHVRSAFPRNSFNRWQAQASSVLITVNSRLERELSSWQIPVPIATCYDAVQMPAPDQSVVRTVRSELLGDGKLLVGSVGRLVDLKGFEHLVRAARQVIDRRPEVRFAIAGDGPLRRQLQDLIAALNLTGYFRLYGFRADVANFLSALDIFACSSILEGGPLTVMEAMLMGKPVVSTEVGVVPEVVLPGISGILVTPSQPAALATAILQALDRTCLGLWPIEQIRQSAARLSDPQAGAAKLDNIMEMAIANARARRSSGH